MTMRIIRLFSEIRAVIPENYRRRLMKFFSASLVSSFLDLVSVAYLVPAILLLLDKKRLSGYLLQYGVGIDTDRPKTLVLGITALISVYVIKNVLQTRLNVKLHHFLYEMSGSFSAGILSQYLKGDYLAFQSQDKGSLIRNIGRVTNDFCVSLTGSLLLLASESITLLVIVAALLCCYFKLTVLALAGIGIFAFCIYRIKKSEMRLINDTYKESQSAANAELLNILDGYIEIKSSGNRERFVGRFDLHNRKLNRVTSLLTSSAGNYPRYLELFLIIGISGLILYTLVLSDTAQNLVLIAVLGALSLKIVPSISRILNAATMVNSHFYSVGILNALAKTTQRAAVYPDFHCEYRLKNIAFSYPDGTAVFEGLDFRIKRGEIIGIKGVTGVGKTTLLHLLTGLLPQDSGDIEIDGKTVCAHPFFPFVSYVPQQPFLFNGTIMENITMRQNPESTDFKLLESLMEKLELKELIEKSPGGLQTVISHNTSKFSGGQKQRIALLRALYHRPQLLILDESTNQQNESLEARIYDVIAKIAVERKMAVITVSHNPDLYRFCQRTYQLEGKKLTEIKTP